MKPLEWIAAIVGASLAFAIGWLIGVQVERIRGWGHPAP